MTVICLIGTNANFYLSTWEEYHTGTLYLSEFSGPVEGILLIVGVFAVTGFVGASFFWLLFFVGNARLMFTLRTGPEFWDNGVLTITGLNSIPQIAALHLKDLPLNGPSSPFPIPHLR